jgi:hypothetical protein
MGFVALAATTTGYVVLRRRRPYRSKSGSPRLVRAALSALDLQRRPARDRREDVSSLRKAIAALRRQSAPRVLDFVTVKRTNPRIGSFGHWWIELDGVESYGWWPSRCPLRVRDFVFGGRGALNGAGACAGGSSWRDPHHLDAAQHQFQPVLTTRKSDRRVRSELRKFASAFDGGWRWSTRPETDDCRTFQIRIMRTVGFADPPKHRDSRGNGCPFLALFSSRTRELA